MPWDAACTRFSSTFLTTSHNDRAKGLILRQCISTSHFICAELEDVRAALEKERPDVLVSFSLHLVHVRAY